MTRAHRTLLATLLPLTAALALPNPAAAGELPLGRYRCYQPPSYTVTAWFDIETPELYSFQGEAPSRFSYDPETRELRWLDGKLARPNAGARYFPPSPASRRHTIVLGAPGDSVSECYLTTH